MGPSLEGSSVGMENIGKYKIETKIGAGGFGEVFKGYDPFIKRHVAVKTCRSDDAEIRERFFQEAEIAGKLQHRNITTVYDFGIHDGLPFLIQEYLSGEDLDVKIKRRDFLPYPEKLYYLLQIARGLGHAHSKGVIHRDIKPANIRILEEGAAKIMDFGIAKLALQESGLTQTGMTLGTAAYLAPEQIRGEPVDLRTDVFSFGSLAYELLTYERPFQGDQISAVLYQLLHNAPRPIVDFWPAVPPELVALVDRCLQKSPDRRFADGNAVARELEGLQKLGRTPTAEVSLADGASVIAAATSPTTAAEGMGRETATIAMQPGAADPAPAPGNEATRRLQPTDQVSTAALPQSALAPALSVEAPAQATAVSPAGLDAVTYTATTDDNTQLSTQPSFAAQATRKSPFSTALGLGLLVLIGGAMAAAGGWWLGQQRTATAADPGSPAASSTGTERPEAGGGESQPDPEPEADAVAQTESPVSDPVAPEEDAAPAPPPTAPAQGTLQVPAAGWTDGVRLTIAKKTYGLHVRRTIPLPPGTYPAVFTVDHEGYDPGQKTVTVKITPGNTQTLDIPIPHPGALTVRPLPGKPQGEVFLDGESIGATPLTRLLRVPGDYQIEVRPRAGEEEGLAESVTLEAGREALIFFDLSARTVTRRAKDLGSID
ncbi:MAG: serine/threonine-protein kinase [Acidobacteriota bacterium]